MESDYATRELVAELGRELTPVADIVKQTGVSRPTVERWLRSEDIEPVLKRGERRGKRTGSLRNTPLALKLEEGVRRRIEEQTRKEEAENAKKGGRPDDD